MTLSSLAGQTCQLCSLVRNSRSDSRPVEPLCPLHNFVEVEVRRVSLGNGTVGAVVDDLGGTHRCTRLGIVETDTIATASHKLRVHPVAAQGVYSNLSNLVFRQFADKVGIMAVVGYGDGHVGLTAAGDDAE